MPLPWIVGGLILILLLAALRRPLEWLVRLAARTGVGLAALWALSGVGGLVGLHLGVNLVNALVLGVLRRPPGVAIKPFCRGVRREE